MRHLTYRIVFLSVYGLSLLFSSLYRGEQRDVGLMVFLLGCCAVPFYYAHFLSGFIVGGNNVVGKFHGNLLININFIKYLASDFSRGTSRLVVIEFLLSYVAGVIGLMVSFILKNWMCCS